MKKKKIIFFIILMTVAVSFFADHKQNRNEPEASLPAGKLPWPHQRPHITRTEYERMINNLHIINNYGQYVASEDLSQVYFHDGLDIALQNGTEIYAVESGYVKAVKEDRPGFGSIAIGNTKGNLPGVGWMYVHTANFQFRVGDYVKQGDHIANVFFIGTPHVHFGKIFVNSGSWQNTDNWNPLHSDRDFVYIDTEPPTIKSPFYYFKNNTDTIIENTGSPLIVSGDIDIVVPMREGGQYARSKQDGTGDWLSITRVEYEISGPSGVSAHRNSFDFTKMILNWAGDEARDRVFVVYKHYKLFSSLLPQDFSNRVFWFYVITNTPGTPAPNEPEFIDCSDRNFAWNTAEKDQYGNPRFPDGVFTISVTAYDSVGNHSTATDSVRVRNKGKTSIIPR